MEKKKVEVRYDKKNQAEEKFLFLALESVEKMIGKNYSKIGNEVFELNNF